MPSQHLLTPAALARLLSVRDLTDPAQGPHAVQRVLRDAVGALSCGGDCEVVLHRSGPIVSRLDEERLGWAEPPSHGARRVSPVRVLRTRMAASMPAVLRQIALPPSGDLLVVCAGTVHPPYAALGRATRDARPAPIPHEAELWRLRRDGPYSLRDVGAMIGAVAGATTRGLTLSAGPCAAAHLTAARTIDVRVRGAWIELGRCGVVDPELLRDLRLPAGTAALSMTLDLDRVLMVAKGIDDARVLRSRAPWVAAQMLDAEPYVPAALAGRDAAPAAGPLPPRPAYVTARLRG